MKTIHVIADSTSMHYGPYLEKYISHRYKYSRKEAKIGNLDNPEGVNGGDSSMVLDYLQKCASQGMYWDLLVVNCGLHDIRCRDGKYQVNITDYEENLLRIFEQSHQIAAQVMWVRTAPVVDELHNSLKSDFKRFNDDVEKYNSVADRIAASRGVRVIDLYALCQSMGGAEIRCDHIHFTDEARKIQGAFAAGQIIAFLESV